MARTEIKKFKNGNINIKVDFSKDSHFFDNQKLDINKFYDFMTMHDLYFNQINEKRRNIR